MNRFVIADPQSCIGCYTCMAACSVVHKEVGLQAYPRLTLTHGASNTMPVQCRHCEDAPCGQVCPVGAITHQDDAIVLDESTCIGCKMCALACPFGAITPHGTHVTGGEEAGDGRTDAVSALLAWTPGVRAVAVKCDLCSFLEQGPACVRVCPTQALFLVDQGSFDRAARAKRQEAVDSLGVDLQLIATPEHE